MLTELPPAPRSFAQSRSRRGADSSGAPEPGIEEVTSQKANALLKGKSVIKVLEAGCGSASHIKFDAAVHAVGIDISRDQLDKNKTIQESILGDLQTYPLPKNEFDVVVCWTVLEHLSRPDDALLNMFASVQPGGLVILGFPNLVSIKGVVTKFTPLWFHTLFYRLQHYKSSPFPTYFRMAIMPHRIMRLAEKNGFSVELCRIVEGRVTQKFRARYRVVNLAFSTLDTVVKILSFGRSQSLLLDSCAMILRKQGK
jgi:SAM-dependent methyltransferase